MFGTVRQNTTCAVEVVVVVVFRVIAEQVVLVFVLVVLVMVVLVVVVLVVVTSSYFSNVWSRPAEHAAGELRVCAGHLDVHLHHLCLLHAPRVCRGPMVSLICPSYVLPITSS